VDTRSSQGRVERNTRDPSGELIEGYAFLRAVVFVAVVSRRSIVTLGITLSSVTAVPPGSSRQGSPAPRRRLMATRRYRTSR
jgi:hypothetical protein